MMLLSVTESVVIVVQPVVEYVCPLGHVQILDRFSVAGDAQWHGLA